MKNILVIFGGRSAEHDVSIITGVSIISALSNLPNYSVYPLYIAKNGGWYSFEKLKNIETYQDSNTLKTLLENEKTWSVNFNNGLTLTQLGFFNKPLSIDIAFPAMHGTNGEDGSLMGLLRLANIPFVGCDLEASSIAMDKVLTKQVTSQYGLKSTPYIHFTDPEWTQEQPEILKKINLLSYPLFVKPVHLGSSIGITKVTDPAQLHQAIEVALHFDNKVIVEEAVSNLVEVTCLALGNPPNLTTSLVEAPKWQADFLNFEDKYIHKGGAITKGSHETTIIPAPIDEQLTTLVQELTKQAFICIGGNGIARCDFLINSQTREIFLNEINPLPGTLYMHNWKKSGISPVELVDKLVQLAIEQYENNKKYTHIFNSSVLQTARGGTKKLTQI